MEPFDWLFLGLAVLYLCFLSAVIYGVVWLIANLHISGVSA